MSNDEKEISVLGNAYLRITLCEYDTTTERTNTIRTEYLEDEEKIKTFGKFLMENPKFSSLLKWGKEQERKYLEEKIKKLENQILEAKAKRGKL